MKLWVDMFCPAPQGWEWIKDAEEAIQILRDADFAIPVVSLSESLGGYAVLNVLSSRAREYVRYDTLVGVHTQDPSMVRLATRLNNIIFRRMSKKFSFTG